MQSALGDHSGKVTGHGPVMGHQKRGRDTGRSRASLSQLLVDALTCRGSTSRQQRALEPLQNAGSGSRCRSWSMLPVAWAAGSWALWLDPGDRREDKETPTQTMTTRPRRRTV